MEFEEELAAARDAAREAGRIMQSYHAAGYEQEAKTNSVDIVTEADVACQTRIVELLSEAFPDDGFIGEEGQEDELPAGTSGRRWVIDPIDGTANYAHNVPYYCTSIALVSDGTPMVGVVYDPTRDELFAATADSAATLNGDPIQVSDTQQLADALVYTEISGWLDDSDVQDRETALVSALMRIPTSVRRPGAAALNLCYVAAGRGDAYETAAAHEWDIAAGQLIIDQADGSVRVQDSPVDSHRALVASNGHLQEPLEQLFDEHIMRDNT